MKLALSLGCAAFAVAVGVPATALAADEAPKPSNCAFASTVDRFDRWAVVDDRTIVIEISPGRQFKVTFTSTCRDAKYANFLRIERRVSSGLCISPGDIIVFSRMPHPSGNPGSEDTCMIKKVEGLSSPGATPKNQRP